MAKSIIATIPVVALTGGLMACSSPMPLPRRGPGELAGGIAEVSVAGADFVQSASVSCIPAGTVTTIETGTHDAGTTSTVASADGLSAKSIEIRNVGGFTGSYWQGLGDAPDVTIHNRTYLITGTAMGFAADNPSARKVETFSIRVAC